VAGGQASVFSPPVPELRVHVLALFAGAGGDVALAIFCVMPCGLHRIYGAHHLHFITGAGISGPARAAVPLVSKSLVIDRTNASPAVAD
jgi:hypothetical protein